MKKVSYIHWSEGKPLPLLTSTSPPTSLGHRVNNCVEGRGIRFHPIPPMTKTPESGMLTAAHCNLSSIMDGRSDHLEGGSKYFSLLRPPSGILKSGK
ncbi:unnamed protein product [Hymenolepis diminuta]|uniref:Uncharacterized protein n=1 Tax=Hymenolepis diminuta TaxID=6216 RepID=A0A564XU75_HYMDI|nr:unnamed protein product [Hymenolepis diminuta]